MFEQSASNSRMATWQSVLATRQQDRTSRGLRLFPGAGTPKTTLIDLGDILDQSINTTSMSATAIISTPTPDRSDDIVEPAGIVLDNYRKNPVVFFDHGFSGVYFPIGKSEDSDGKLTVVVTDSGVEATTYFSSTLYEARQIFDLITERIIRSTSIHLKPLVAKVRTAEEDYGRPGLHITEWELLEYSWVAIPDNPEAVRKVLDRGKLADEPICESILKSLLPYAAVCKIYGKGFDADSEKDMAKTQLTKGIAKAKADEPKEDELKPADDESTKADDLPSPDEGAPDEKPVTDEAEEIEEPLGAQVLASVYGGLKGLVAQVESAMGPVENPPVKEFLAKLHEMLGDLSTEVEEMYGSNYDGKALTKPEPDEDESDVMKSLRQSALARLDITRLTYKLKGFSTAKNLNVDQRATINTVTNRLAKMLTASRREATPAATLAAKPNPETAELLAQVAAVSKQFGEMNQKLSGVLPFKRQAG